MYLRVIHIISCGYNKLIDIVVYIILHAYMNDVYFVWILT